MKHHTIQVGRTAHYYTEGVLSKDTKEIWIVLHGYAQHASDFIKMFEPVASPERMIIAPEALSVFYRRTGVNDTGASWMTRYYRELEIHDYIKYLNLFTRQIKQDVSRTVKIKLMGFSQGAETAARWFCQTRINIDSLIIWCGKLPPDIDTNRLKKKIKASQLILVHGKSDKIMDLKIRRQLYKYLNQNKINFKHYLFASGHTIHRRTLQMIFDL